jgi:hypothetical protein
VFPVRCAYPDLCGKIRQTQGVIVMTKETTPEAVIKLDEKEEKVTAGGELEPEWMSNLNQQFEELSERIDSLIDRLESSKPPTPEAATSALEQIQARLNKLESSLPGATPPDESGDGPESLASDTPPQAAAKAKRGLFRKARR